MVLKILITSSTKIYAQGMLCKKSYIFTVLLWLRMNYSRKRDASTHNNVAWILIYGILVYKIVASYGIYLHFMPEMCSGHVNFRIFAQTG